ncbi:MAG TPA: type II toxin-antitoxin system ParD family antitoxin [Planctomycetota bacterium]|nr:type II toxin-antitoxin system ParD family antitoxin [Planctomycetota bacterium]
MNVSLTPELERLVQSRVASGRYSSASEVIREALRLLADRDASRVATLDELRQRVGEGLVAADRGEVYGGKAVFDEARKNVRARGKRTR